MMPKKNGLPTMKELLKRHADEMCAKANEIFSLEQRIKALTETAEEANRSYIDHHNKIQSLRQQLADTQQKLEEAEKRNEGRDLYAWRYARLSERNNIDEAGVPYVVALTERGTLEHLYFGACGQACDIEWPMPDRAIEQSKGGDE